MSWRVLRTNLRTILLICSNEMKFWWCCSTTTLPGAVLRTVTNCQQLNICEEVPAVSCISLSLEAASISGISLSPEDPAGLCLLLSSSSPEDPACLCLLPEYTADICTSSSCCVGSSLILTTVASADDVKLQTIELEQGKVNTSSSLADLSGMDGTRGAHQVDDIDADDKKDPDEAHQPDPVQQICHGRK